MDARRVCFARKPCFAQHHRECQREDQRETGKMCHALEQRSQDEDEKDREDAHGES